MDADHLQRFAGIGRLYGRAGMERLARSSFLVVGLGGVGSWTVEALARSGVGHLALVDGDGRHAPLVRVRLARALAQAAHCNRAAAVAIGRLCGLVRSLLRNRRHR